MRYRTEYSKAYFVLGAGCMIAVKGALIMRLYLAVNRHSLLLKDCLWVLVLIKEPLIELQKVSITLWSFPSNQHLFIVLDFLTIIIHMADSFTFINLQAIRMNAISLRLSHTVTKRWMNHYWRLLSQTVILLLFRPMMRLLLLIVLCLSTILAELCNDELLLDHLDFLVEGLQMDMIKLV